MSNGIVNAVQGKVMAAQHFLYQRTDGRVGHRMLGVPCLLLRTVGAKSGEPRVHSLTYARDGDACLVVASNGGAPRYPAWYHNLRADPAAEIQVARKRQRVTARFVTPGNADYERLWSIVNEHNRNRYRGYQKLTDRPIPVVVLSPA